MKKFKTGISMMLIVALVFEILPTNTVTAFGTDNIVPTQQETIFQLGDTYEVDWTEKEPDVEDVLLEEGSVGTEADEDQDWTEEESGGREVDEEAPTEVGSPEIEIDEDQNETKEFESSFDDLITSPVAIEVIPLVTSIDGEYDYTLSGSNATITKYNGSATNVMIPGMIDGNPVTAIGDRAFYNNIGIRSVIVPSSVLTIGAWAFKNCTGLQSLTLNEGLTTIHRGAFNNCAALRSVTIPNSVTTLNSNSDNWDGHGGDGGYANGTFRGCTSLTSVTIGNGLQEIQPYTFYDATALQTVNFGSKISTIGSYAFLGCSSLDGLDFSTSSISIIGDYAFENCTSISSLNFSGTSISTISNGSFQGCVGLTSINFGSTLATIGERVFYNCRGLNNVITPVSLRTIGAWAFKNCTGLQSLTLNDGLSTIHRGAFNDCSALRSVTIPNSVTTLNSNSDNWDGHGGDGGYANGTFRGCTSLTSVTIGNGLQEIQPYTFYGATALQMVNFGSKISTIGSYAFWGCSSLDGLDFSTSSISIIGDYAFENCTSISSLNFSGTSISTISNGSFQGCVGLTSINFGSTLATIGERAFYNCRGLNNVITPVSLRTIGAWAFKNCTGLQNLTLNNGLTTIHRGAFNDCVALRSVAIPNSVTTLNSNSDNWDGHGGDGGYANGTFRGCTSLTSVTIGNGLQEIQPYTFYGATALQTVNFGTKVNQISSYAFYDTGLQTLNIPNTVTTLGTYAFANCGALSILSLGNGIQAIPDNAFQNCISMRSFTFGSSVKTIGAYAFSGDISLPNLSIPNTVTTIGNYAFQGCRGITSLLIGNNVYTIGTNAFQNNTSLKEVTIGASVVTIGDSAFRGNTKLQTVEFSSSVQQIGNSAFQDCTSLLSATIPANVWKFGNGLNAETANGTNIFRNAALGFTVIGVLGSPAEEFAMNNGYLFEALRDYITLDVDETTNRVAINVSGSAPKGKVITVYDGNTVIGTFTASANRRYGGIVTLVGGFGTHTIKAETTDKGGSTISATKTVMYEENAPRLTEFAMYHDGQKIDLITMDGIRQTLIFRSGRQFTFEVKVDNADQIKKLRILSERNGVYKSLDTVYDSSKNLWITTGYFDPNDTSYVPGRLSVEILLKGIDSFDSNYILSESDLNEIRYNIADEIKNAEVLNIVNTDTHFKADIVLTDGTETSFTYENITVNTPQKSESTLTAENWQSISTDDGSKQYYRIITTSNSYSVEYYSPIRNVTNKAIITSGKNLVDIIDFLDIFAEYLPGGATAGLTAFLQNADYKNLVNSIENDTSLTSEQREAALAEIRVAGAIMGFVNVSTSILLMYATVALATSSPVGWAIGLGLWVAGYYMGESLDNIWDIWIGGIFRKFGINSGAYQVAIDPSGYVYEAVTTNRLTGVTVTVYHKGDIPEEGTLDDDSYKWDASEYDQYNPLITDHEGRYAWDVPEGLWQVKAEHAGYETTYSEWLPVPPPQTEVHISMVSYATPEIVWFNVYDTYAEVEFTKYMKPETVGALTLKTSDGTEIPYTLSYSQDEQSQEGRIYAKRYKLVYKDGYTASNGNYSLTTNVSIQSYADVSAKVETSTSAFALPVSLVLPENVEIDYGTTKDIIVNVKNYDLSNPVTITAVSDFEFIAQVVSVSAIGADGKAIIRVSGSMPGPANIIIRIAEKGIEATLPVWVNMPSEKLRILISPTVANVLKGATEQFTAIESKGGTAADVVWSVSGNVSSKTKINESGLLTVAAEETAETLTITAVYVDDGSISGTAIVNVTSAPTFLLGDVNGDGRITIADVDMAYRAFRGLLTLDETQSLAADANKDGRITIADVDMIYRAFRGLLALE